MATGQYLADVAQELVARGHEVTVMTSRRVYDDPQQVFPREATWRGVRVLRVGSTGFGKGSKWRRAADFGSFMALCVLRLLRLPRQDVIVALTSPPLISFIGAWLARLRRSRFVYWVMDFNPDEAIVAGWLRAGSMVARILDWMSRFSLREAAKVIALDRFMRERIIAKGTSPGKVVMVPPWALDQQVHFDPAGGARFRKAHGLENKFVVMYSGNHSPCHPLDTLLGAAGRLADDPGIVFCFVGGGSQWRKIRNPKSEIRKKAENRNPKEIEVTEENKEPRMDTNEHECRPVRKSVTPALQHSITPSAHQSTNPSIHQSAGPSLQHSTTPSPHQSIHPPIHQSLLRLPYQPLDELSASLSAADLHVVVMGEPFVGLVHPCKVYNILAVGAPVLYIGPKPSHVTEIFQGGVNGASTNGPMATTVGQTGFEFAKHGDVEGVLQAIQAMRSRNGSLDRRAMSRLGQRFSRNQLLPRLIEALESVSESQASGVSPTRASAS